MQIFRKKYTQLYGGLNKAESPAASSLGRVPNLISADAGLMIGAIAVQTIINLENIIPFRI
jgi:hypothetical protein